MVVPTAVSSRKELKATLELRDGASLLSETVTVMVFGTVNSPSLAKMVNS